MVRVNRSEDRKGSGASGGRSAMVYEPPAISIIGPVTQFTFGSKNNGNDAGPGRKN